MTTVRSDVTPSAPFDPAPPGRSLLVATLQISLWLLFRPSAWRGHVARLDPALRHDFSLSELSLAQWRRPELQRFLLCGHVLGPLLVGALLCLELWALGVPVREGSLHVVACVVCAVVGSLISGAGTSVAIGMAVGVVGSLGGCVAFAAVALRTGRVTFPPLYSLGAVVQDFLVGGSTGLMAMAVAFGAAFGAVFVSVGGLAVGRAPLGASLARSRPLGGTLIGLVLGGATYAVAVLTSRWLSFERALVLCGFLGGAVAAGWLTRRALPSLSLGLICALGNFFLVRHVIPALGNPVVVGILIGGLLSAWFTLPYLVAERLGGLPAGVVAGALGLAGGWVCIQSSALQHSPTGTYLWPVLVILPGMVLAVTQDLWRPLLLYPLEEAFGLILYRLDQERRADAPCWLRWHAAFWDELQGFRLHGLDEHLVLILEQRPQEGRAALEHLAAGPQRWAAQAAQIEVDVRSLERCASIADMVAVLCGKSAEELEGPASSLLRTFKQQSHDVAAALAQHSSHNQRLGLSTILQRLEGLVSDLNRRTDRYAIRFRPAALRWRSLLGEQVQALSAEAEQRQELDNPYVIGVPLTMEQEIFVGRTDISVRIEQFLLDRRRPPLLLYGQRRTGKTSLLNNLGRLLPISVVPLFVDLQGPVSSSSDHARLLYNLARGMVESARKQRGLALPVLRAEVLAADPFTAFDEWLDLVEGALGEGRTALLSLDELESLDNALAEGRFNEAAVLGLLRHLVQHRPRFKLLFASSRSLDELLRWSSYFINVLVVPVGYLTAEETRQLVERPVPRPQLSYESAATERVLGMTRGHPFLVQLLCAEIVALKNEQEPALRRLTVVADVEEAAAAALHHGSFFFADIERNQVDAHGRAVLRALAAAGEGATLPRAALGAGGPEGPEPVIAALLRRELIEPAGTGLRFQVELIRRWFAQLTR